MIRVTAAWNDVRNASYVSYTYMEQRWKVRRESITVFAASASALCLGPNFKLT